MSDLPRMRNEIRAKLFELADEFAEVPETIEDGDNILELGILDSLGVLQLLAWYEEQYGFQLSDDEVNVTNLGTIADMAIFAAKKMGNA